MSGSLGRLAFAFVLASVVGSAYGQTPAAAPAREATKYRKIEAMIPMRDGRRLYTSIYVPTNRSGKRPILMERTPYSAGPYGEAMRTGFRGSPRLQDDGFIFAFQDVRGRYMSEGDFVNTRPVIQVPSGPHDVDESTDTYDTVEWLVKNVPENNGKVGIRGISYPGGYAALAGINSHPNLAAISPQAPTADWFKGDDFHHNGALFLQDGFSFLGGFGQPRPEPIPRYPAGPAYDLQGDAYKFFLELGPLSNVNERYFKGRIQFWNDMMRHGNYDEFWQSRSIPTNMKNVRCAVMTVGGWYDAEDLWGPLNVYAETERLNPRTPNVLVMGPWSHGQWMGSGTRLGDGVWGSDTSLYFREEIEYPFWKHYLDGKPSGRPEAHVFNTGLNAWRKLPTWPPKGLKQATFSLDTEGRLTMGEAKGTGTVVRVSDPANPTPYQSQPRTRRTTTYMLDDQRFAASRDDVAVFQSEPLAEDITWAGPVTAHLSVSMTGTDADFIVKVIDVLPEGYPAVDGKDMKDYQMLVRAEVMRGKFRNSLSNPSPFRPGRLDTVRYTLPDVLHTFRKGHRIMIQVQHSWFPLVDRNPNQYLDIYSAKAEDYVKNSISLHLGGRSGSRIEAGIWKPPVR